jgi:hypothetical protein
MIGCVPFASHQFRLSAHRPFDDPAEEAAGFERRLALFIHYKRRGELRPADRWVGQPFVGMPAVVRGRGVEAAVEDHAIGVGGDVGLVAVTGFPCFFVKAAAEWRALVALCCRKSFGAAEMPCSPGLGRGSVAEHPGYSWGYVGFSSFPSIVPLPVELPITRQGRFNPTRHPCPTPLIRLKSTL